MDVDLKELADRAEECAATVAWLRDKADGLAKQANEAKDAKTARAKAGGSMALSMAAGLIERGEHRRTE